MSNKPIEVGCKVLVINNPVAPSNVGKVGVVVGESDPNVWNTESAKYACWEVQSLGEPFMVVYSDGGIEFESVASFEEVVDIIRLPDEDDVLEFDKELELENV